MTLSKTTCTYHVVFAHRESERWSEPGERQVGRKLAAFRRSSAVSNGAAGFSTDHLSIFLAWIEHTVADSQIIGKYSILQLFHKHSWIPPSFLPPLLFSRCGTRWAQMRKSILTKKLGFIIDFVRPYNILYVNVYYTELALDHFLNCSFQTQMQKARATIT